MKNVLLTIHTKIYISQTVISQSHMISIRFESIDRQISNLRNDLSVVVP